LSDEILLFSGNIYTCRMRWGSQRKEASS